MVRIKQTGKPKATPKINGTPKSAPTQSQNPKSPAQPAELSDADKARIKIWLDKQEKPFSLMTAATSKKRKRNASMQLQTDIFEERLDIQYEVKPKDKWECLRRYKKFTVGAESIAVGQCVLVKHDESEDPKIDIAAQWKGKVLEVRALDSEHVYIRLAWLNRPEDLEAGRKSYHGKNELIPTNQMDIIDAMAVNGSVQVEHWDEKDDDSPPLAEDEYFWRQTFDFANTKTFSKLRLICKDNKPQNPDEIILQCGNKDCRQWLHVKCIAEAAVQEAADEAPKSKTTPTKGRTKQPSISSKSAAVAKAETNSYTAEVFIKGEPSGRDRVPAESSEIVVTTPSGEKHAQDVTCLFCKADIE